MCGILGMIGAVPNEHATIAHTILQNIFIFNRSRGGDASGFSAIHNKSDKKLITEKRAIDSLKFVERSAKFKALRKDMPNILIGHTRASTSGTPKRGRNNHPFNSSKYSMVHNGGITSWRSVATDNKLDLRSETDSEIILRLAEQKDNFYDGISHTMDKVGTTSRVAVAFLRHEGEPRLFLFRNMLNPISIMTYPRLQTIFFSSEAHHLRMALKSVFGEKVSQMMREHEINIEAVPDWKSLEFMLVDNQLPELISERNVSRPYYHSNNNTSSTSINSTSSSILDNSDIEEKKSLPIVMGPSGRQSFTDLNEASTKDLLERVSEDTRRRGVSVATAVREATDILKSVSQNAFMPHEEMEHFKKWMKDV
jgi:predicted glutamine amidotransferase